MYNGFNISAGLLSVTSNTARGTDIVFYINLGLMFCALIEMTAFMVLCKKTSCARAVGIAAVAFTGVGTAVYFVQLFLYIYRIANAAYAVYVGLAVLYAGFVVGTAYCIMLSRNSHKALCLATGVLNFIPPIGAVMCVKLSYSIKHDSRAQELVFNGYAYTYAALGQFCAKNGAEFVDMAGEEEFETLDRKQIKRRLRELKKAAVSPETVFRYASAVAYYTPDRGKAVKLMAKSAQSNYAPALFNLGYYRELGLYVKRDYRKAAEFYRRAAAMGDADAQLRLCILEIKTGRHENGIAMLKERAEKRSDLCAKYNLGVCIEKGVGGPPDALKAVEVYNECADLGLFIAQKRIFAMASADINSAQNGDFFRKVTDRPFYGTFDIMIKGLIEIKKRHAADAARYFLTAVTHRDRWEGLARCLVGTLYLDRGSTDADRINGAAFIKSAVDMLPGARSVYSVIPEKIKKQVAASNDDPEVSDTVL